MIRLCRLTNMETSSPPMNKTAKWIAQELEKPEDFSHLRECIRLLALKRGISQNEAMRHALEIGLKELEKGLAMAFTEDLNDLSARQRAVLQALRKGLAVKEVADDLKISEVTVRTHIQRIRTRLGCPDLLKLRMR